MQDPRTEYLDRRGPGQPGEYLSLGQGAGIARPRGAGARAAANLGSRQAEVSDVELRRMKLRMYELSLPR